MISRNFERVCELESEFIFRAGKNIRLIEIQLLYGLICII